MPRRSGDKNQLWDNFAVGVSGVSNVAELPRRIESFAIYVTTSAATTVSVEVAHSGDLNSDGTLSDANAGVWYVSYYLNTPLQIVFASAGSASMIVPDFVPGWIRLRSTAAATITAGWEGIGE